MQCRNVSPLTYSPASCVQPRTVAGFRGTVRYASVNAHKNKVSAAPASFLTRLDLDSSGSTDYDRHQKLQMSYSHAFSFRKWVAMTTCGRCSTCWWSSLLDSCPGERSRTRLVSLSKY